MFFLNIKDILLMVLRGIGKLQVSKIYFKNVRFMC